MRKGGELSDFMAKGGVALGAFELVIRYVVLVKRFGRILGAQDFRFIVTLHALPLRDVTVPLDNTDMTSLAGYSSCDVLPVIEVPSIHFDIPFGLKVAGSTSPDGAREAILLTFWACLVVVTDETVGLVNGEV
jgi:hypothetical protein